MRSAATRAKGAIAMFTFRPGSFVALEGLDGTGKSTQLQALRQLDAGKPAAAYLHMPSGVGELTSQIYKLLEVNTVMNPVARQLLHLASHSESRVTIQDALKSSSVVLDRFWWSTVAYGLSDPQFGFGPDDAATVKALMDSIWADAAPSVVFLFTSVHDADHRNRIEVMNAYAELAAKFSPTTVLVPDGDIGSTTEFLLAELERRSLVEFAR